MTKDQRVRRLINLGVLAFLILVIATLVRCWGGNIFPSTVEGLVIDAETHRPIANAHVLIETVGLGPRDAEHTLDNFLVSLAIPYRDSTRTRADGSFRLSFNRLWDWRLITWAPGFVPYYKKSPSRRVTVLLAPATLASDSVAERIFNVPVIDYEKRSAAGAYDFTSGRMAAPESADVVFDWPAKNKPLEIVARGNGGILFVPRSTFSSGPDLGAIACVAPDTGYVQSIRVQVDREDGICFIRTRDGQHFAKVELDRDYLTGGVTPACRSWFNRSGERRVCSRRLLRLCSWCPGWIDPNVNP